MSPPKPPGGDTLIPPLIISRRSLLLMAGASAAVAAVGADLLHSPDSAAAAVAWGHPFSYRETPGSPFGPRNGRLHAGQDYPAATETPIYAVADGVVAARGVLGTDGAYGNAVYINHADGWSSRYAHMHTPSPLSVGQSVRRGQYVGPVGSTGRSSGAHLHIELRRNGTAVDPLPYIQDAPLAGAIISPTPPEEPVPVYHRRQGNYNVPIGTSANTRLYFSSGQFDMATGAGGSGLYQITTHADFTGLTPEKVLTLQYYLLHAATDVYSGGFLATFPGVVGGNASVEFSTIIPVPPGNHLFVAARCAQGGVNQTRVGKMSLNYGNL